MKLKTNFGAWLALLLLSTASAQASTLGGKILERLRTNSLLGIEYIEAGPRLDVLSSRWGLAVIRFIDGDADPFNDVVLGFVADTSEKDGTFKMQAKAVTGYYPVRVEALTMSQTIQIYSSTQWRSLRRVIIPTTSAQIKKIVGTFERFEKDPEFAGHYYFLGRNCATLLQGVLRSAGVHGVEWPSQAPTGVIDRLRAAGAAPWPALLTTDLIAGAAEFFREMGANSAEERRRLTLNDFRQRFPQVDDTNLKRFYVFAKEALTFELRDIFLDELERRSLKIHLDEVYDVKAAPGILYVRCSNEECYAAQTKAAREFWSKPQIQEQCGKFRNIAFQNRIARKAEQKRFAEAKLCE